MKFVFAVLLVVAHVALAQNNTVWTQSGIHTNKGPGYLGQITDHHCGPHSLMQCIYKITGIDMKEATLGEWAGTTQDGTSHEGIEAALKKFNAQYGKSLGISWSNFHDVTQEQIGNWMADSKSCVFFHMLYKDTWGHYELPYEITSGSDSLTVANSLGYRSGQGYEGWLEPRTWALEKEYIAGISQKSVCVIKSN